MTHQMQILMILMIPVFLLVTIVPFKGNRPEFPYDNMHNDDHPFGRKEEGRKGR